MTAWTSDELSTIAAADEIELAPLRSDGRLRTLVTIWVVRYGDDLYIRSWRGHGGSWFRATQARHEGQIQAGGMAKDVTFVEETDPGISLSEAARAECSNTQHAIDGHASTEGDLNDGHQTQWLTTFRQRTG